MLKTAHQTNDSARIARRIRTLAVLGALVVLYALGLGMRRHLFDLQRPAYGRPLPFTLESALHYRLVRMAFSGDGLPALDSMIEHPEGIRTFSTDTVGAEYVYAALAHLFPALMVLSERVRWIELAWFCLGIPLMALWIRSVTRSWTGGLIAGLYYAVSLASVIRSTGQEISHENFALPLLLAHLALDAAAGAEGRGGRLRAAGSAVCFCAALITWDMIQYYLALWSVVHLVVWLRRPVPLATPASQRWWPVFALLFAAGLCHPYLRAHGFLRSPPMLVGGVLFIGSLWRQFAAPRPRTLRLGMAALLAAAVLVLLLPGSYAASYGHFAELLGAKIRFLNHKPADPALLTFNQRIMWTPALHSATWGLTLMFFPCVLWLTCAADVVLFRHAHGNGESPTQVGPLIFHHVVALISFVFFVRFHVFTALFSSAVLGCWAAWAASRTTRIRWLVGALLTLGAVGETAHVLTDAERWGGQNVYYREAEELAAWLRAHADAEPVLANFGVSAFVLTYGHCPIVLHPKFESPEIRRRVEAYCREVFRGTEQTLRDWADGYGARYYVYSLGEFAEAYVPYQMRYMADALKPPETAPARLFEFDPAKGRLFRFVWGNKKYRVFRIVSRDDEAAVRQHVRQARDALARGALQEAEACAVNALKRVPDDAGATEVLGLVDALRQRGFRSEDVKP